mmetsp:Transcript_118851/g.341266  ORF Transcript_118851/g.341266 Transcript_118851/m.341266 type:complete len:439 (-) Transcript_118851:7-1323(-)
MPIAGLSAPGPVKPASATGAVVNARRSGWRRLARHRVDRTPGPLLGVVGLRGGANWADGLIRIHPVFRVVLARRIRAMPVAWPSTTAATVCGLLRHAPDECAGEHRSGWQGRHGRHAEGHGGGHGGEHGSRRRLRPRRRLRLGFAAKRAEVLAAEDDIVRVVLARRVRTMPVAQPRLRPTACPCERHRHGHPGWHGGAHGDRRGLRPRRRIGLGLAAQRAEVLVAIDDVVGVVLAGCVRAVPVARSPLWPSANPSKWQGTKHGARRRLWPQGLLGLGLAAERTEFLVAVDDIAGVVFARWVRTMPIARSSAHWAAEHAGTEADQVRALVRSRRTLRVQRWPRHATLVALRLAPVDCVLVVYALRVRTTPVAGPLGALTGAALRAIDLATEHEIRWELRVINTLAIRALPVPHPCRGHASRGAPGTNAPRGRSAMALSS